VCVLVGGLCTPGCGMCGKWGVVGVVGVAGACEMVWEWVRRIGVCVVGGRGVCVWKRDKWACLYETECCVPFAI
jgi:hypothetical protein